MRAGYFASGSGLDNINREGRGAGNAGVVIRKFFVDWYSCSPSIGSPHPSSQLRLCAGGRKSSAIGDDEVAAAIDPVHSHSSVVSLKFIEEQPHILRLTPPELKDLRGLVRSE